MPNVVGNPDSGLRQAQKCIVVKPVNWHPIYLYVNGSPTSLLKKNPAQIIDVCLPKV